MGFVDLFRAKWKHSDAEVRAAAVRDLSPDQIDVLQGIAQNDRDAGVRRIAIKKLEDPLILNHIAQQDPDESLRQLAAEKASALLVATATSDADTQASLDAQARIDDQRALAEVAKNAALPEVRLAALQRLSDDKALAEVVRNAREPQMRLETLRVITDVAVLRSVALNDERKDVCLAALERLEDREALEAVSRKAKNKTVRAQARKQLNALGGSSTVNKKQQSRRFQLCEMVEVLSRSSDWERTGHRLEEAQKEWDSIGAQTDAELQDRFQQAVKSFFTRFSEHRERQVELQRREREVQQALAQRVALCEEAEALQGDDVQQQVLALRQRWDQLPAVPASHREVIEQRFARACDRSPAPRQQPAVQRTEQQAEPQPEQQTEQQRQEQTRAHLDELCVGAEKLLGFSKPQRAFKRYAELKSEWARFGRGGEIPAEVQQRFEAVGTRLEQLQQQEQERREQDRQHNLDRLQQLCERMLSAASGDKLKHAERLLKEAQSGFRQLGELPSKEDREALDQRYQAAREKLFTRVQELREADEWKRWAVVPKLEALCDRVEALAKVEDLKRVSQELRKAQSAWKKAGPAPRDKAEPLWRRFKQACDDAYARCQEHFVQLDQERDENLKQKRVLCEEVERLAALEPGDKAEWDATANQIKELQGQWKKIGPVPRAQSDAVWKRFRKACDAFFARRQEQLEQASGERDENLKRKLALCDEVERLAGAEGDQEEVANQIKGAQARWKKIGPVPRAQSDAVWARFRQACDLFFDRRQQQQEQERIDNQAQQEALCQQLEVLVADGQVDPAELSRQVLEIRGRFKEIGPAPQAVADALWDRLSSLCEQAILQHPEQFVSTELDPVANEKKQQRLCQRAEELLQQHRPPASSLSSSGADSVELMAEQLRTALAQNALRSDGMPSEPDLESSIQEVIRLQSQWRRVGPVPGEPGRALAERFSHACDGLFQLRPQKPKPAKPQPSADEGTEENLQAKQLLCEQAEALAAAEDPAQHQAAVRDLRRQWKAIGPVPRSQARRLWNQFRRACNRVMSEARREGEEPGAGGEAEQTPQAGAAGVEEARPAASGWDATLDSGWDEVLSDTETQQEDTETQQEEG